MKISDHRLVCDEDSGPDPCLSEHLQYCWGGGGMNGHGTYDEDSGLKLIRVSAILVGEVNGRDAYDEGSEWARPLLIGASAGRERESPWP